MTSLSTSSTLHPTGLMLRYALPLHPPETRLHLPHHRASRGTADPAAEIRRARTLIRLHPPHDEQASWTGRVEPDHVSSGERCECVYGEGWKELRYEYGADAAGRYLAFDGYFEGKAHSSVMCWVGLPGGTRAGSIDPALIFHHTPSASDKVDFNGSPVSKGDMVMNKYVSSSLYRPPRPPTAFHPFDLDGLCVSTRSGKEGYKPSPELPTSGQSFKP